MGFRLANTIEFLLKLSLISGGIIAIVSLVEEICMVKACRDTLSFTVFGVSLSWIGIVYFAILLILLFLRRQFPVAGTLLPAFVFAGIGAEFRLLWIQKFVIGAWCPFCVSIALCLFTGAAFLTAEEALQLRGNCRRGGWLAQKSVMAAFGLAAAYLFVRQLE